jgi:hypothetical protein
MKKRAILTAAEMAVLICLLAWPLPMRAQRRSMTEWEATVRLKLLGASFLIGFLDAQLAYPPYLGRLEDDSYFEILVPLHEGVRYALLGVCDDDCRTLNMKLYDEDDDLVAQDTGRTATPEINIAPKRTQRYTVHMIMKRCDEDPCYYGLGVYSK